MPIHFVEKETAALSTGRRLCCKRGCKYAKKNLGCWTRDGVGE